MLETDRLILRPWQDKDFVSVVQLRTDPAVMVFWPTTPDAEDCERWFKRSRREHHKSGLGRLALELKQTGAVIGYCGIDPMQVDGQPVSDLGYGLFLDAQGKGYVREAAHAVVQDAITNKGITNLACHMPEDHDKSRNVTVSLGFKLVHRFANPGNRNIVHLVHTNPGSDLDPWPSGAR